MAYGKKRFHINFRPFKTHRTIYWGDKIPDNFRPDLKANDTLMRKVLFRRETNMNCFIAVVGAVRSGKSYFALWFAEQYMKEVKKEFNMDRNGSFEIRHFLRWSQTAIEESYVLDEIQTSMSPREWFSIQHKVFNEFCDVQGWRKNLLLMPFPNISFIDKHLRFLMNFVVRTTNQGRILWFAVRSQPEIGKANLVYIGSMKFPMPTKETIEKYEVMKRAFTDDSLEMGLERLDGMTDRHEKDKLRVEYWGMRNKLMKKELKMGEEKDKLKMEFKRTKMEKMKKSMEYMDRLMKNKGKGSANP